ncbi:copper-binding protein [Tolumonas lignilytica]|jgi:Uncharacterized conserved protein|uniref:copper-binding protein n=1 Tax=Tolumonas lignilytica TaxID=1283284 RepID=UPI000466AE37|nr:copper-binding protein [Tolumonas lignilytica]
MKNSVSLTALAVFSLITAVAAQAEINSYRVHGTVQQIDEANQQVTLAQDGVSELGWPMRTMTYKVNSNDALKGLAKGQPVDASFTADSPFSPVIHDINKTAH